MLLHLNNFWDWLLIIDSSYIEKFADIAALLHNLTKKDVPFTWSPECNKAFAELKNRLTQIPILAFPQFTADAAPFKKLKRE